MMKDFDPHNVNEGKDKDLDGIIIFVTISLTVCMAKSSSII